MTQHIPAAQALAAGVHSLPGGATSFAATQAAWRFFHNPRVTRPQLAEPLRAAGRQAAAASRATHLLVVHDGSVLAFSTHPSKTDRITTGPDHARGYDRATALLVDGGTGHPLAPMDLAVTTADGVRRTRTDQLQPPLAHIDQVLATMQASATWGLEKPLVHVIDREADGLAPCRDGTAAGHRFVVRIDPVRRVPWEGESHLLPHIVAALPARGAFRPVGSLDPGQTLLVAETTVVSTQPGRVRVGPRSAGRRRSVPGEPLTVRLVVSRVVAADGGVQAEWLLATNGVDEVTAAQVAPWSAWRWRIESFFKLLKGHGQQVESWQQESGQAIAKRLAVTAMACVLVWQVVRDDTPAGRAVARRLVRLSGRQMKRSRPVTAPAVLAGLEKLLAVLALLDETTVEELRSLLHQVLPPPPGYGSLCRYLW